MKSMLYVLLAVVVAVFAGMPVGWAQSMNHRMVSPNDLKWSDVPSLPPGAKIAVIEGPISEAVPFTFRLKFPANYYYCVTNTDLLCCRRDNEGVF
jgi:hypothetical protein